MRIDASLDATDVDIITTQERLGSDTSTTKLGEVLGIAGRTIRYRLNRLKEQDILRPPSVYTHERKLGLGECTIILQTRPQTDHVVEQILNKIPSFYWYAPTYGQYEGILAYCLYPLSNPRMIPELAEAMKQRGLIEKYYFIDIVDYHREGADLARLTSDDEWTWEGWREEAGKILDTKEEIDLELDSSPQLVNYDEKDVQVLKMKVENPGITLREIGERLEISQPQAHNKLKNLEDTGIIRGYKPYVKLFDSIIMVGIFLRSRKKVKSVLQALHRLPLFHDIAMESNNHYYVRIGVPPGEIGNFLSAIRPLRRACTEFILQIILHGMKVDYSSLMDTFSGEKQKWTLPMDEYLDTIEKFSSSHE